MVGIASTRARRVRVSFVLFLVVAFSVVALRARADHADANIAAIRTALSSFSQTVATFDSLVGLAEDLPLTDASAAEKLKLGATLAAVQAKLDAASSANLHDASAFVAFLRDTVSGTYGGVVVDISGPAAGDGDDPVVNVRPAEEHLIDVVIEIAVTADDVQLPIAYESDEVSLDGSEASGNAGRFAVDFSLRTTPLHFQLDTTKAASPDAGVRADAFALRTVPEAAFVPAQTGPAMTVRASADEATIGTFNTVLGFADITVEGRVSADLGATLALADPAAADGQSDDRISAAEWAAADLPTLVTASWLDAPGDDFSAEVRLSSSLVDTALDPHDASLTFAIASAGSPLPAPTFAPDVALGDLIDFRNFTAQDALSALNRLSGVLQGLQDRGTFDLQLPFVDGTFSDALRLSEDVLAAANALTTTDVSSTPEDESGRPTFKTFADLITALGAAPGAISATGGSYNPATKRLTFDLELSDSATRSLPIDFGTIDVLSGINFTAGGTALLDATFDLDLTVGFDLRPEPTEGADAPIGSCQDGVDNNPGESTEIDAADPACASSRTLEQRVFVDVGPEGTNEVTAGLAFRAIDFDAKARIGMLEAGIDDGSLKIGASATEDGGGAGSCIDGTDNGGSDGADAADPECAFVTVDLFRTGTNTVLTLEDIFNTLGGTGPADASFTTDVDLDLTAVLPVSARLSPSSPPIANADITVTASHSGPFDPLGLVNSVNVDASQLRTSELFEFSPCGNGADDDGDGTAEDGCPLSGVAAVDDAEFLSTGLFDQVVRLVRLVAGSVQALQTHTAGSGDSLDEPLPLIGRSFNDLLSFADSLEEVASDMEIASEAQSDRPGACTNNVDDDGDGIVNDGCPTVGDSPESGAECGNNTDSPAANDPDTAINDGCPPALPTLQSVGDQLARLVNGALNDLGAAGATGVTPASTFTLGYDAAANEITFDANVSATLARSVPLDVDLSGIPGFDGKHLAFGTTGDLGVSLAAGFTAVLGIDLDDLRPFVLGNPEINVGADVEAPRLLASATLGPVQLDVGTTNPSPEATCDDDIDNDRDGVVDDGDAESCDVPSRPDVGRFFLGADFTVAGNGPAGARHYLDTGSGLPGLSVTFDGDSPDQCGTPAKDACAVLPLYLNGVALGNETTGGHHIEVTLSDITNPSSASVSYTGDPSALAAHFAQQLLDLALVNTGLGELLARLEALLNGELLDIELPLIGDQLAEIAGFIRKLRTDPDSLLAVLNGTSNPMDALMDAAQIRNAIQNDFASAIGNALLPILLDTNGDGTVTASDFMAEVRCGNNGDAPCDIGGEADPANPAAPPGDNCGIGNDVSDDGSADGRVNDGCPAQPNPETGAECTAVDDEGNPLDEDGDGTANDGCDGAPAVAGSGGDRETAAHCTNAIDDDDDGYVNDGCDPKAAPGSAVSEIRFKAKLGQQIGGIADGFDLATGLPGLGLDVDTTIQGSADWTAWLNFGVNRDGFFLVTNPTDHVGAVVPELSFGADITIPGTTLEGTLGFLQVRVQDGEPSSACNGGEALCQPSGDNHPLEPTSINPRFVIDIDDPGDDDRFTMNELVSGFDFDDVIAFTFAAQANLGLHTETSVVGAGATLPRLFADIDLDWNFSFTTANDPDAIRTSGFGTPCGTDPATEPANCFSLVLNDVAIDAGSFLNSFLAPMLRDVQQYTKVLDPAIKVANEPIPGLSELAGEPVTLLKLAELFGGGSSETELLVALVKLVSFVNGIESPPSGNLTIPIGDSFPLDGRRLQQGTLSAAQARDAFANASDLNLDSLLDDIDGAYASRGGLSPNGDAKTTADLQSQIGISFPFLQEPGKLMGLLFGQDVDLAVWRSPKLNVGFTYAQKFGPIWATPPVFVELGGSLSLLGEIALGYDTQGLREVAFEGASADALLRGLFVLDKYDGTDPNILSLRGELFANAQVSVLIFSAGAGGKFYTTIGIDVHDPNADGKTKYQEVAELLRATGSPLCLFELNGAVGINVYVFAEVDLLFWSQRWEKTIADALLFEFKVNCDPASFTPPVLASKNASNEVTLHLGAHRGLRGANSVAKDEKVEKFKVTKLSNTPNSGVEVSAFGFTTVIDGPVSLIKADGGTDDHTGADVITLADGLVDDVPVPFDIPSDVTLSGGDDVFVGSLARDVVRGKNGADVITLRDGNNEAHGDGGNDRIQGGADTDTLNGNGDNDVINGELGGDTINGGSGDDQLVGGVSTVNTVVQPGAKLGQSVPGATDGIDTIDGSTGRDTIDGGDGADILRGGADPDNINGGPGNDTINGGEGGAETTCAANPLGDVLVGGPGSDTVSGDGGDDIVIGGNATPGGADEGDAQLNGGAGCDRIFGDNATLAGGAPAPADPGIGGADTIDGGPDADRLYGQTGADTISGAAGNDRLWGADGGDRMDGGDGNDFVYGEAGDDDVVGGDGADRVEGGDGGDVLLGDRGSVTRNGTAPRHDDAVTLGDGAGVDHLYGGTGDDVAYGQAGGDFVYGQSGIDHLYGGSGNDFVSGGTGADRIEGNDGADDLYGDSGNDRILGGSSNATTADTGRDEIYGREGNDVIAGDNATGSGTSVVLEAEATIGDGDLIYGDGGEDRIFAGLAADDVYGGYDNDYIEGNANRDRLFGEHGDDDMIGGTSEAADGDADGQGGQPDDGDVMEGGSGADVMVGDNGRIVRMGVPSPFLVGAEERDVEVFDLDETNTALSGVDTMRGGLANDQLFGGGDDDVLHGDAGDDYVEGNGGNDRIWGGDGQDDLIGGTSAEAGDDTGGGHPDGADEIVGGDGDGDRETPVNDADVIAGDNASIRRFTSGDPAEVVTDDLDQVRSGFADIVRRQVELYDIATTASPNPAAPGGQAVAGGETIFGEAGPDVIYGQGGNDTLHGNGSDDYLEGNAGDDTLYGEAGQDDLIGGTGRTRSDDAASASDGRLDGIDRLYGGDGTLDGDDDLVDVDDFDVLAGDNATILRDVEGDDHVWEVNSFNDAVRRRVWLYDVGEVGNPAAPGTAAGDFLYGEADPDLGYGQGGNDHVEGAGGDDYLEGNDGNDTILGQVGNDDLIGGTGRINDDAREGTDGRLDAGETLIQGGPGFDTIAGDNAVVTRVLEGDPGQWVANTFNGGISHDPVRLRDVAALGDPAGPGTSGGDTIEGNADDDVIYGQGGGDTIAGDGPAAADAGGGDDYVEGNEGNDTIRGGRGEDDLVGGTGRLAGDAEEGVDGRLDGDDQIRGEYDESEGASEGDGGDWIFGDNAIVTRPLTPLPAGDWHVNPPNGVTVRDFVLLDLEVVGSPADPDVHGGDVVYGNDNDDTVYGQGGNDELHGGAGDDDIDGNSGGDRIYGDGDQDDLIGGSHVEGRLDGDDQIWGGPGADFQLGDNGTLVRTVVDDQWTTFVEYNATTIVRHATRFDVGGPAGTSGNDEIHGNAGDDYQWGQDGNDVLHGDADNDDMYGELGDDWMYGGTGEDAMVGDRGRIVNTKLVDDNRKVSYDTKGPAFFTYVGLVKGQLDRRVSLTDDGDGAPYPAMGIDAGGRDRMRGGPGHDSMHGAFGDDLMNGDSGGDWMFGSDGADVMWGGKGADNATDPADPLNPNARDRDTLTYTDPFQDRYVDLLFGGHGGLQTNEVEAADILDYLPRPATNGFAGDPQEWFVMTDTHDGDATNDQHHQGIDWIYGGFDRDVLEGDVGKNGPDFGDRLVDWTGAYNLYTRCNASYGDDGDIRQHSPQMEQLLLTMAYGSGAGLTADEVRTSGSGAFRELGLVYASDNKLNSGSQFPTTPGHYQQIHCSTGSTSIG